MGIQRHWSLTPGTNQTADPVVNQREGMALSQVNDSIRQIMVRSRPRFSIRPARLSRVAHLRPTPSPLTRGSRPLWTA
jgi:hypothetical protein